MKRTDLATLETTDHPLHAVYDLAMLDLDGVVYRGRRAVPGAARHLSNARARGIGLSYVTNNAARPPDAVAEHLTRLGVPARPSDVVTSAQAAARLLVNLLEPGSRIFLLGGTGLEVALREQGLIPVTRTEDRPVAVVSGFGPNLVWSQIIEGASLIRSGLPWVASNNDRTVPTQHGLAPGHGALVDLLRNFSGITPIIAGKPERPILDEAISRMGALRPLMIGDRLDTDIRGARNAAVDSLLVLTGVTGLPELVAAVAADRPTYLATDLGGLMCAHEAPGWAADRWTAGGWHAVVDRDRLSVRGRGVADDWWRCATSAAWQHLDRTGKVVDTTGVRLPD